MFRLLPVFAILLAVVVTVEPAPQPAGEEFEDAVQDLVEDEDSYGVISLEDDDDEDEESDDVDDDLLELEENTAAQDRNNVRFAGPVRKFGTGRINVNVVRKAPTSRIYHRIWRILYSRRRGIRKRLSRRG